MIRAGIFSIVSRLLVFLSGSAVSLAEATNDPPDFKEVYDLVRAHATGLSEAELNRAAVQALVTALGPGVSLVTNAGPATAPADGPLVGKSGLFDGDIAYLRVARVDDGLANALRQACGELGSTNKLKGVVLDLRYAGGDDYASAAAAADIFLKTERPLLDWGNGVVRSKEKSDALTLPVAVLVNHQTAGAAEALAGVLRETGTGLILGNKTAGQAMISQEFPLKTGDRLRIATAPIRVGDGTALAAQGLKPDISVTVSPEEEKAYYSDAFKVLTNGGPITTASLFPTNQASGTNRIRRPRFNEAELVRERRDGVALEDDLPTRRAFEPEKAVVRDPALARALDLLKGLAVVRQSRS